MTYPKAPWALQGYAIQTVQLRHVERVRPFIPPEFEIIRVLPGKTVGGIYISHYGSGSMLEYSELIVAAGLVRYSDQLGGWISHIYVDNPVSVAGGRDSWGLQKELVEFTWEQTWLTLYENQLGLVVHEPQILERPEPAINQA